MKLTLAALRADRGRRTTHRPRAPQNLSAEWLTVALEGLEPGQVGGVTLPRFDFRFKASLVDTLEALGQTW